MKGGEGDSGNEERHWEERGRVVEGKRNLRRRKKRTYKESRVEVKFFGVHPIS
jgi:hypothetical protein